jgi:endogenous inhibitor of DNA gyrase (YacG/DUF329 family)
MSSCVHCRQPITVTSRNPNRRFCSPRCRVADWHVRQRQTSLDEPATTDAVSSDVTNAVMDVVRNDVVNGVAAANGVQRCPHCRQSIAVISVLVPEAAAHIATPEVST